MKVDEYMLGQVQKLWQASMAEMGDGGESADGEGREVGEVKGQEDGKTDKVSA